MFVSVQPLPLHKRPIKIGIGIVFALSADNTDANMYDISRRFVFKKHEFQSFSMHLLISDHMPLLFYFRTCDSS